MATQAELEAQGTTLQQERTTIEAENQRLEAERAEIESRNAAIAKQKEEAEQAKAQLSVIKRMGGDTSRFEPFAKQKEAELTRTVQETTPLIEKYNVAAEGFGEKAEQYNIKVEGYGKEVEDYNKKQEEFGSYLQAVAEGRESVEDINISTYTYPGSGGDTVFGYSSSRSKLGDRYSGGTSYWGEKFGKPWETSEEWTIAGTKSYLGLGAEDVIRINGRVVQESSFTPEQITIANQVFSGRMSALAAYERERELEQDRLKTGMLIEGTAKFAQPASFIEAYKAITGNAPTAAQVNVTPYVQSEEHLRAKAIMLSSPTAQFTPDVYASEYVAMKERTAYPIEATGTKKIGFAPAIETDETGQIKFYGVEGAPGVQISKRANEVRLAEINKQPIIITPNGKNIILTSPAPEQPEIIYNPKYGLMKRADLVKSAEQKIIEERDKEAERLGLNTGWEGTKTRRASAYLITKSTEAEEAITEWENELYMGAPDVPRILVGEAAKAGIGIGTIVAGLPIIVYGAYEKPELMGKTIKTVAEPAVLTTPKATAEMITTPIEERGLIAGGVAIAGTVTGFYLSGKALGAAGKGVKDVGVGAKTVAKVVVSDIKRGAEFPEGKAPAFPGYVWLRKTKLADGTVVVKEEVVDLRAKDAAIERAGGKPSKEGLITVVKPKAEVINVEKKNFIEKLQSAEGGYVKNTGVKWKTQFDVERVKVSEPLMTQADRDIIITDIKAKGGLYQPATKAELNLGGASGVKAVPIIITDQKGKAGLKTEAPAIEITGTGLKIGTAQETKATTISAVIQKGRAGQRQETPQVTIQKQKTKQVPVITAKAGLDLKTTQDTGQIIRMDTPTITRTKTTEITTPKTPQITRETTRRPPDKTPPPKKKPPVEEKLKDKGLDLGLKKGSPKIETPKKAGKDNPLYPASFESVTAEEFGLKGKRAKHIRERGVTQELFEELKGAGRPIPTARQFKKRKNKGKE